MYNKDMMLQIFNHPEKVSEWELEQDLAELPLWRRKKAMSFHFLIDRVLCAKAFLLLKRGVAKEYVITEQLNFDYINNGKPVLRNNPAINFNLSHCHRGVICAISSKPVGCDIEEIETSLDLDLAHHCFNEQECRIITESEKPCVEFTKLWTVKEAVLKLTGDGINDDLPSLLTADLLDKLDIKTVVCENYGYVYSVCRYKAGLC